MLSGVMLGDIMLNVTASSPKQVFTKCLTNILKNILTTRRPYKLTLDFKNTWEIIKLPTDQKLDHFDKVAAMLVKFFIEDLQTSILYTRKCTVFYRV